MSLHPLYSLELNQIKLIMAQDPKTQAAASLSPGSPQINLNRLIPQTAQDKKTIFVGIAGGTASGKTTVAEEIFERVRVGEFQQCTLIPVDCFYKECTPEQMANIGKVNFDHPSMFDWDLVKETVA